MVQNLSCFNKIPVNPEWGFGTVRSTEQWTHGYHRYPAKFLPNLVKKLIEDYTAKNDLVVDFFAGCGTTLVEAKVHGRKSIGVDINPVAELITYTKTNPILPKKISKEFDILVINLKKYKYKNFSKIKTHERIDYWFSKKNKAKIAFLHQEILKIKNKDTRYFFLVSLSHIFKNCSRWLQTSTKPQVDPHKVPADPFIIFKSHTRQMMTKNQEFYEELLKKKNLKKKCEIRLENAKKTSLRTNSVDAIITSPPYVTSYEYADIHQLTTYWFDYASDFGEFRKKFIGTFYSLNQDIECRSFLAQKTINSLLKKDKRTAKEVANYFIDMQRVATEMNRVLKPKGHACLVIGNTTFKNVKIKSAEIFTEYLIDQGLEIVEIIKRTIPYKLIPTIRDRDTGKFTKLTSKNSQRIYPEEYIIVAKKK